MFYLCSLVFHLCSFVFICVHLCSFVFTCVSLVWCFRLDHFKMYLEASLPSVCDFEVPGNSKVDFLSFYHVLQREC